MKSIYVREEAHAQHPIGPKRKGSPRPSSASHVCQQDLLMEVGIRKQLGYHVNKWREREVSWLHFNCKFETWTG